MTVSRKSALTVIPLTLAITTLTTVAAPPLSNTAAQRRTPVVEVFEAAKNAVVNISSTQIVQVRSPFGFDGFFEDFFDLPQRRRELKRTSVGSGFVLHSAGYIVTNAHVVARTAEQKVIFADKHEFNAQVIAIDHERDLAVLKIEPSQPLVPLTLGRSNDLMVGETAIAIGNPLGYQHTVTAGVVSALDRTLEFDRNVRFEGLIQTDASINPGNSGGPLLNVLGQLIGVNTAIRGDAQNIGFAIPVDQLRSILPELLDVERRYQIFTGLQISADDTCRITQVIPGSPAQRADLKPGDTITHVDDQGIQSNIDFHIALIGKHPGHHIRVRYERTGTTRSQTTTLTLAQRTRPDGAKLLADKFGIEAESLTPKMARTMGMRDLTGLMITKTSRSSPAQRAKLQRGDVIVHLGRHRIATLDDAGELLETIRLGQRVRFTILRVSGRAIYRIAVELEAR